MGGATHSKESCPTPSDEEKVNYFEDAKKYWIYHKTWTVENPKGIVIHSHGFGEHINSLPCRTLAKFLNDQGFIMAGVDVRLINNT